MRWEDLDALTSLYKERESVKAMIERLRSAVQRTSPNLDGMPHGGQQRDIMAEYAANYDEANRRLSEIERMISYKIGEIEYDIIVAPLNENQHTVIWSHYVEGKDMKKVSHEMYLSLSRCYKIRDQALKILGIERGKKGNKTVIK